MKCLTSQERTELELLIKRTKDVSEWKRLFVIMTAWLKDHGFTFKRPEKIPGKIDPAKQAEFIEEYKRLKASLSPNDDLYFIDAVHPEYQSQAVSGWIKKRECKTLQTTGKQKRLHFTGALSLKEMNVYPNNFKNWFLAASASQQIFCLHSRFALEQSCSLQNKKIARPSCQIPNF